MRKRISWNAAGLAVRQTKSFDYFLYVQFLRDVNQLFLSFSFDKDTDEYNDWSNRHFKIAGEITDDVLQLGCLAAAQ